MVHLWGLGVRTGGWERDCGMKEWGGGGSDGLLYVYLLGAVPVIRHLSLYPEHSGLSCQRRVFSNSPERSRIKWAKGPDSLLRAEDFWRQKTKNRMGDCCGLSCRL